MQATKAPSRANGSMVAPQVARELRRQDDEGSSPTPWVVTMRIVKWIPLLLAGLLAACAQQPARDSSGSKAHHAIDYAQYVKGTVPWFHFSSLYSWDSNQPGYVVVWTSPVQAYRLALVGPCLGLQRTGLIGLTSQAGEVSSTRDSVIASGDHCRIMRIERLDARAIRAANAEPKASDGKED
ncbi:MAG TPA: DUF6491 family protein [Rhodanobacteraceae bacterium]|nr:DUF6491 family protein [Rhodanobacteraceae bacterium]